MDDLELAVRSFLHYEAHGPRVMANAAKAKMEALMADYQRFDLRSHLERQHAWSVKTFGPGPRAEGVVDHIRKELLEIEAQPEDLEEWVDVVILAFDGALREGHNPLDIIRALIAKQTKNEGRTWPDWRTADPGKAIEHEREEECRNCDGCGWYEGGPTLQTTCSKCKGTGVVRT